MPNRYVFNKKADLKIVRSKSLDLKYLEKALLRFDKVVGKISKFEIDIFSLLGMRNLSAFLGEVFAASLIHHSNGLFEKNPHQDGYPDLLLSDNHGRVLLKRLAPKWREKKPFSPFKGGGIEVKATCGSVPSPKVCKKRGLEKPDIGDERIEFLMGYDWKAHHRKSNYLLGILWDFKGKKPVICAVFYCNKLKYGDWGKIVKPKDGGGNTTSVSIMKARGVKKMYRHWVAVIDDPRYADFLNRRNKDSLIPSRCRSVRTSR